MFQYFFFSLFILIYLEIEDGPSIQGFAKRGYLRLDNRDFRDFKTQRRDGDKNVAEKVNLRYFSLYSDYSYPLTLSILGEPSWSWISRDQIQAQKEK